MEPSKNLQPDTKMLEAVFDRIDSDRPFRMGLARESHLWFFMTYLGHHMSVPIAPFHREIFRMSEDDATPLCVVSAFRGSGKSTIISLSYPIWAALSGRKKFILVISKTETQAKQILYNIKAEFESNARLAADFGPCDVGDVWNETSLVLPKQGARIVALSADSSLRGLKNLANRPDLIVIDDVEDLDAVRTSEVREKRYRWLKSEVIPAGNDACKVFVIGNLLHQDSLVARLRDEIEEGEISGVFRQYPIIIDGQSAWPGKYPTLAHIEELKRKIGDQRAFKREYMQEVVTEQDQVIEPEWIRYYEKLPDGEPGISYAFTATGIDIAASQKESADYTAMVTAYVYHDTRESPGESANGYQATSTYLIYVAPIYTNERLTLSGIVNRAKYAKDMAGRSDHRFYLEDAGTQILLQKPLQEEDLYVVPVGTDGMDKRSRLMLVSRAIETGRVMFPKQGAEEVIAQILGFPREKHDDLVDAFSMLVRKASEQASYHVGIWWL